MEKKKMFSSEQLRRLILPLLVEQLLAMLVGMIDTIMVSSVGEEAISGVSIVNDVNNLAIMMLAAVAGGGSVIVSQYLGNRDNDNTNLSAGQLILLAFVISGSICILCLVFHSVILHALYGSVSPGVMNTAIVYFRITALSFPFLGLYNAGAAIFRSQNLTRITMYVSFLMNTLNVVGNYFGVYVLRMGVAGVAWPTLISRMVAAVVILGMLFYGQYSVRLKWNTIVRWRSDIQKRIISIALPNGIENGLFQLGKILVSAIVATMGTSAIAANGVANSLVILEYTTESTMSLAVVTVIGQCVGANDYEQAEYYFKHMLKIAWILAIGSNVVLFLIMPYAVQMYSLTPDTRQIALILVLMESIAIASIHPPAFVLPSMLRAAGDAKYTMYAGVFSMFLARVGGAFVLGKLLGFGVIGTRIAMYLDWIVRILFFVHRHRSSKWKEYRVIS